MGDTSSLDPSFRWDDGYNRLVDIQMNNGFNPLPDAGIGYCATSQ